MQKKKQNAKNFHQKKLVSRFLEGFVKKITGKMRNQSAKKLKKSFLKKNVIKSKYQSVEKNKKKFATKSPLKNVAMYQKRFH